LVQENDELVNHRIAQQSTESRLAIFGFVHRQRCMAKRSTLSSTLPRSRILETSKQRHRLHRVTWSGLTVRDHFVRILLKQIAARKWAF
jgi:hypothetical protein